MRITLQCLLHLQGEAIHAATHVGDAGSEPDPYAGGRDDHPRSTDMTRRSATRLTSLPTRTHVPSDSSISIRSASAAASLPGDGADDTTGSVAIGGTAPVTCIGMNIRGRLSGERPGARLPPPRPQQPSAHLVATRNLRHRGSGPLALRDDPQLLLQPPTPPTLNPGDDLYLVHGS